MRVCISVDSSYSTVPGCWLERALRVVRKFDHSNYPFINGKYIFIQIMPLNLTVQFPTIGDDFGFV